MNGPAIVQSVDTVPVRQLQPWGAKGLQPCGRHTAIGCRQIVIGCRQRVNSKTCWRKDRMTFQRHEFSPGSYHGSRYPQLYQRLVRTSLGLERATSPSHRFACTLPAYTAVVHATLPIPVNYETKYQLKVLLRRRRVCFNNNRLQMAGVGIFTKFHSAGFTFCFGL